MKSYTELEVWIDSRKLAGMTYSLTKEFSNEAKFGLTNQIRRSAVSVVSTSAEGSRRGTGKNTDCHFHISRSSFYELETQLYRSLDGGCIMDADYENVQRQVIANKKLLNGFINYHKKKADA